MGFITHQYTTVFAREKCRLGADHTDGHGSIFLHPTQPKKPMNLWTQPNPRC